MVPVGRLLLVSIVVRQLTSVGLKSPVQGTNLNTRLYLLALMLAV